MMAGSGSEHRRERYRQVAVRPIPQTSSRGSLWNEQAVSRRSPGFLPPIGIGSSPAAGFPDRSGDVSPATRPSPVS